MALQQADNNDSNRRWRSLAAGLFLAALLTAPLVLTATKANPPSRSDVSSARTIANSGGDWQRRAGPSVIDAGPFAFGYLEFDSDPENGVPGFDSWPGTRMRQ